MRTLVSVMLVVALAAFFVFSVAVWSSPVDQEKGQQVHFNGKTLDLTGAANVMVQSSDQVRTWDADQNGGAITQTTSIVTVTIWMKP